MLGYKIQHPKFFIITQDSSTLFYNTIFAKNMELKLPYAAKLVIGLLIVSILVWWMYILQEILILISFAILFSLLLFPLCNRLEKWKFPRTLAISLCLIISTAIVAGLIFLVFMQIANFSDDFPTFQKKGMVIIDNLQSWASKYLQISRRKQVTELRKQSLSLLQNGGTVVTNFLASMANSLSSAVLVPILTFFFLLYRDFFKKFFYRVFGIRNRKRIDLICTKIYKVVQGYIVGLMSVILIVAVLNTIGLMILGIDYAIFFGTLAAFLLLIPYIGIMIGSLLPILLALITKDSYLYAVGVAGVFFSVQFLEGNFITPYIVGSKVSVNPLAAMIGLVLGGQLWGISGLILALPFIAILKVIFDHVDALKPYGYLLGEAEVKDGGALLD